MIDSRSQNIAPPSPEQSPSAPLIAQYLEHHDAKCPFCEYNLRNLKVPRCPECGNDIRLTIGMTEPYLLPWISMQLALAMPVGVGLMVSLLLALNGFQNI